MSSDPFMCQKKDKRMLVLLAFGSLIILFRLCFVFIGDELSTNKWVWSEGSDQKTGLHRWAFETATRGDQTPLARDAGYNNNFSGSKEKKVSPRAAFLLGLPFPINSSSAEDLEMLPGIGPKLAGRIVEYRDRYGIITDRHMLMKVPGIGPKMSARLTPLLTFEEE